MAYDWLGKKPWEIQKTTTALLTNSARAYVLNEFGTGKTRSVIWAADYLRRVLGLRGRCWCRRRCRRYRRCGRARYSNSIRAPASRYCTGQSRTGWIRLASEADWYIINHHGLALILDALVEKPFSIFVIDELAVLRNSKHPLVAGGAAYYLLRE